MNEHVSPECNASAFTCPHCHAYAQQNWQTFGAWGNPVPIGMCIVCKRLTYWVGAKMVNPISSSALHPHPDLPDEIRNDFEEARSIAELSPRGSAALLRLCIQKLCKHLGQSGKNINSDIGKLVEKGLPARIQKALDIVRVTGNNAVHPGEMNLEDNPELVTTLFSLVNLIVEDRISNPKHVEVMYASLPQGQQDQIQRRDGTS